MPGAGQPAFRARRRPVRDATGRGGSAAAEAAGDRRDVAADLWEPACGKHGNIVDVLRRHGHRVIGSDLVDYGRPDFFARRDFLLEQKAPGGCGAIITNPPFKLAEQFVAHALELCPRVVMLLRLAFMESERRTPILEGVGLKHIFVFRKRMPMMHRAGWEGRKANSGMAFGWFCWDCRHRGATLINRISWERDG